MESCDVFESSINVLVVWQFFDDKLIFCNLVL